MRSATNRALVQSLRQDLDAGEAEAIALAMEMNADLLLIDERVGRESAQHLGVTYMGLIGVLRVRLEIAHFNAEALRCRDSQSNHEKKCW